MHIADKLQPFLGWAVPTDDAYFQLDISEHKFRLLMLSGLGAVASGVSAGATASATPVASVAAVTDAATTLSAAGATPRKVGVYNNGTNDVLLTEGTAPPNFGTDLGILLEPGDYFESPISHVGDVRAICDTGLTSSLTVTVY